MIPAGFWHHPAGLVVGPVVWSVWFVVLYAGPSLACRHGWLVAGGDGPAAINLLLAVSGLLVAGLLSLASVSAWRAGGRRGFLPQTSAMILACSAAASLLIALPGLIMAPCL